jgi:ADP-ribose pyrophosphatase
MKIVGRETLVETEKWNYVRQTLRTATGRIIERDFLDHPGSVVIIPRLDDGRLVMERNYRHALDRSFLELPAGTGVPREPPLMTAQRELTEETGYFAERWTELFELYPALGLSNERMLVYLAEGLSPGPARHEIDEEITVELIPLDDVVRMTFDGSITDGKTLAAIWWLHQRRG